MTRTQRIVVRARQRRLVRRALDRVMLAPSTRRGLAIENRVGPPIMPSRMISNPKWVEECARYEREAEEKKDAMRQLVEKMGELLPDGMLPLIRKVLDL